jgi:hypothetical protein
LKSIFYPCVPSASASASASTRPSPGFPPSQISIAHHPPPAPSPDNTSHSTDNNTSHIAAQHSTAQHSANNSGTRPVTRARMHVSSPDGKERGSNHNVIITSHPPSARLVPRLYLVSNSSSIPAWFGAGGCLDPALVRSGGVSTGQKTTGHKTGKYRRVYWQRVRGTCRPSSFPYFSPLPRPLELFPDARARFA